MIDPVSSNFVVENSIDSIKVTIHGRKQWGWFLPSLFVFLANGFCFLPILGLVLVGVVQKYLPGIIQSIVLIVFLSLYLSLYLLILYRKFLEVIGYIFEKEAIEISEQSIKIERSGFLGFRASSKLTYAGCRVN